MYRLTKKAAAQRTRRMARSAEERAPELPALRRQIIIRDFDFGETIHTLDLYKSDRRDCYRVLVDGKPWKDRIGWSAILAGLRKSMPRVGAE